MCWLHWFGPNKRPDFRSRCSRQHAPTFIELLDALGRPVLALPVGNAAAELILNVEYLPAGIYLLRVAYKTGMVTRRVAVQ